jgi:hypothetical protein
MCAGILLGLCPKIGRCAIVQAALVCPLARPSQTGGSRSGHWLFRLLKGTCKGRYCWHHQKAEITFMFPDEAPTVLGSRSWGLRLVCLGFGTDHGTGWLTGQHGGTHATVGQSTVNTGRKISARLSYFTVRGGEQCAFCTIASPLFPYLGWLLAANMSISDCLRSWENCCEKYNYCVDTVLPYTR